MLEASAPRTRRPTRPGSRPDEELFGIACTSRGTPLAEPALHVPVRAAGRHQRWRSRRAVAGRRAPGAVVNPHDRAAARRLATMGTGSSLFEDVDLGVRRTRSAARGSSRGARRPRRWRWPADPWADSSALGRTRSTNTTNLLSNAIGMAVPVRIAIDAVRPACAPVQVATRPASRSADQVSSSGSFRRRTPSTTCGSGLASSSSRSASAVRFDRESQRSRRSSSSSCRWRS